MSHAKNKVKWCLRKSEKEKKRKHRGLIKVEPNLEKTRDYIKKSEHYFRATTYLKEGNFSDISASTIFYSIYHSLLAIITKFGYESRNQECTFALIYSLIEDNEINFEKELLDKITSLNTQENPNEKTGVEIREKYQYGTELSIRDDIYEELIKLAQEVISKTKEIIEK